MTLDLLVNRMVELALVFIKLDLVLLIPWLQRYMQEILTMDLPMIFLALV